MCLLLFYFKIIFLSQEMEIVMDKKISGILDGLKKCYEARDARLVFK